MLVLEVARASPRALLMRAQALASWGCQNQRGDNTCGALSRHALFRILILHPLAFFRRPKIPAAGHFLHGHFGDYNFRIIQVRVDGAGTVGVAVQAGGRAGAGPEPENEGTRIRMWLCVCVSVCLRLCGLSIFLTRTHVYPHTHPDMVISPHLTRRHTILLHSPTPISHAKITRTPPQPYTASPGGRILYIWPYMPDVHC